uniref:MARVEL domain-containing protein n=1 Tax=Acrobeloides nanus TaxID=290746 RepID=A0A914C342_9BILA
MFTPGWRYSDYSNEGVITDHYGDLQPYETAVVVFLFLTLVFEIITILSATYDFFCKTPPPMLLALEVMVYLPAIFLIIVLIIYGAGYKDAHGIGLLATSRANIPLGPGFYPDLSLGYSYWLSLVAAILLVIAGITYAVTAFLNMRLHRHNKHTEVHTITHHIEVHS